MKTLITMVAVIITAMTIGTSAEERKTIDLHAEGHWRTWYMPKNDDGEPMCVMSTDLVAIRAVLTFKYFPFSNSYDLQAGKSSWKIPVDTEVAIKLEFDKMGPWSLIGRAFTDSGQYIGFPFEENFTNINNGVGLFLTEFAKARSMVIIFEGNEPQWKLGMSGSHSNAIEFLKCVRWTKELFENTQPFSNQNESNQQRSPVPTNPFAPTDEDYSNMHQPSSELPQRVLRHF